MQQSSTELGTVITEQAVADLPLDGRNFTQLMILTPGANSISTAQGTTAVGFQHAGVTGIPNTAFFKPALHGQQNRSLLYYLDGIINNDFRGSIYGLLPIIDAVDEFPVQSHNEKTEYGGVTGGIVNLVSKSGVDSFHGSDWEFVRNNAFDARNPFLDFCNAARGGPGSSSLTPASPVAYHQNEFGAAAEGPKNTVLRAAHGIYYDTVSARSQKAQNAIEGPAWPWTTGIGTQSANAPAGGLWPGATGNPVTLITNLEGNFSNPVLASSPWITAGEGYTNDPNLKEARFQQWNVEIQRQFSESMLLSVAYVGSKNTRLDYTGNANAARQASPQGTPAAQIDTLKLMSFKVPTWNYSQSLGYANHNALEVKFQKRWAKGLQRLLSYTWSRSLDISSSWFGVENGSGAGGNGNAGSGSVVQDYFTPSLNYGSSAYNILYLLVWSAVYDFPLGRGKQRLSKGPASWVLGNWQAEYVSLARSGQPFHRIANGDIANISGNGGTLSGYGRPNLVGNPTSACTVNRVSIAVGTVNCFYNPAAFAIPSFSFGNLGRDTLRDDPFFNMDFSLIKNVPLRESLGLQLRFEGFNVFNFQTLGTPAFTIGQSCAGVVSGIASTPRQLQMAAKFTF